VFLNPSLNDLVDWVSAAFQIAEADWIGCNGEIGWA
jgi:hypothetical protein